MKRKTNAARNIAFQAVLTAIMLVSMFLPKIGLLSFAFLPLIAVSISALYLGFRNGIVTGLIFGLMSLVGNVAMPTSVLSPYFQNPLISVLPRVLIGAVAFGVAFSFKKLFPRAKSFFSDGFACLSGVLTNTGLVLGLMLWIYGGEGVVTPAVIGTIFVSNSILEIALTVVFTPLILAALRKAAKTSPYLPSSKTRRKRRSSFGTITDPNVPAETSPRGARLKTPEGAENPNNPPRQTSLSCIHEEIPASEREVSPKSPLSPTASSSAREENSQIPSQSEIHSQNE